jgi:hypothetical protein
VEIGIDCTGSYKFKNNVIMTTTAPPIRSLLLFKRVGYKTWTIVSGNDLLVCTFLKIPRVPLNCDNHTKMVIVEVNKVQQGNNYFMVL